MRKLALIVIPLAALTASSFAAVDAKRPQAQARLACAKSFRWPVKTLNDRAAKRVGPGVNAASVRGLLSLRRPRIGPRTRRLKGVERRTYRVRARLISARLANTGVGAGNIELVVADPLTGEPLQVGFPDPGCAAATRPLKRSAVVSARDAFLEACGEPPTTHFARLRGTATLAGIGFFGPRVGPAATRNGLELQPVLYFRSSNCERLPERPMVVAAAGDIACDPDDPLFNGGQGAPRACRMLATSDLLVDHGFDAVFPLGDTQYDDGAADKFLLSYGPTWGRVKEITRPVVGNHEYRTPRASGYFSYFGPAAGVVGKGYYSFDIGAWHVIALNANCNIVRCNAGSPQERWLRADLAAHPNRCVLAMWHHPYFTSGRSGGHDFVWPFWDALYRANADLILNGHDHDYERFAPQSPAGLLDTRRGIREFVVGTGGSNFGAWGTFERNSEIRDNKTFGVLKLTLYPSSYEWQFVPVPGSTFTDSGSAPCH